MAGTVNFDGRPLLENRLHDIDQIGAARQQSAAGTGDVPGAGTKALLFDESSASTAGADTNGTIDLRKEIRPTRRITMAIIGHDRHVVVSLAERITAMTPGTRFFEEPLPTSRASPRVSHACLVHR